MTWIWASVGAGLVLLALADNFFTVLHYDSYGFMSSNLYRVMWAALRRLSRPLPSLARSALLSLGVPLMIAATLAVWLGLLVIGFALIYYAGMSNGQFVFEHGARPGFPAALALSGASASTTGFTRTTPRGALFELLSFSEGVMGIGVITLTITYVIGIFGVLRELSVLSAGLHHQAEDTEDPRTLLVPHFQRRDPSALSQHLHLLYDGVVSQYEGMRHYPIVYYFHARRSYRSLPYALHIIGDVVAALSWGLHRDNPLTRDPWLTSLLTGYRDTMKAIQERFLSPPQRDPPQPVSLDEFTRYLVTQSDTDNPSIARFVDLNRFMSGLSDEDALRDPKEAHDRYKAWLTFSFERDVFLLGFIEDLGYAPEDILPEAQQERVLSY